MKTIERENKNIEIEYFSDAHNDPDCDEHVETCPGGQWSKERENTGTQNTPSIQPLSSYL